MEGNMPEHVFMNQLTEEERLQWLSDLRKRVGQDGIDALTAMLGYVSDIVKAKSELKAEAQIALAFVRGAFASLPPIMEALEGNENIRALASLSTGELCDKIADDEPTRNAIIDALLACFEPEAGNGAPSVANDGFFDLDFWPMLNGPLTNSLKKVTGKALSVNQMGTATATLADGTLITVANYGYLKGALSVSTNKLLDTATAYLTRDNYFHSGGRLALNVHIPLIEYGKKAGYHVVADVMSTPEEQAAEDKRVENNIHNLRKAIKEDLEVLYSISISGKDERGKKVADFRDARLVQDKAISNGNIEVTFGEKVANYLVNAYQMQFPVALLGIDNRHTNAYFIGWKLAFHNSNDQNAAAGTANTLSVASLLESAPEIATMEQLQATGQRNWKRLIKKPLEAALDEACAIGFLSRWEYRHPRTAKTYTSASADALTWDEYARLMVDFAVLSEPEQEERRARRQEDKQKAEARREKAAVAAESGEKRKRGRPRKMEAGK